MIKQSLSSLVPVKYEPVHMTLASFTADGTESHEIVCPLSCIIYKLDMLPLLRSNTVLNHQQVKLTEGNKSYST